jgi:hypothetical protein
MLSRNVSAYPYGETVPAPAPPLGPGVYDAPATDAGMDASRFGGQQDTLTLTGPVGAGDNGYMGRDISDPGSNPVPESRGMFGRLHSEGAPG